MKNKRFLIILQVIAILLLIPFAAGQFTDAVNWTSSDYVIMGILLLGTGITVELVLQFVRTTWSRIALVVAVLGFFLLTWAELAVGIFGTPFAGT